MTKDTEEFSQFTESVACREYTLPRDEKSSDPKGWIRGNTLIGPVLEVTTSYLQGKYGVEIRIESVNKDNSHSWVRISHGLNKLVTALNNKEQVTSEVQFEDFALKTNVLAFASRSKAKAKPPRRTPSSLSTRILPIRERKWTDVEPEYYLSFAYPVSKRLSTLLRHGGLPREDDGAIEFWRIKDYLRNDLVQSQQWSDEKWKSTMAKGGGTRKDFNIVLIHQDKKFFISELFKVIQDANPLILHCSTMYEFRTISSSTFITSDAQSIYIPSSIQDWYWEVKNWAKDWKYSFCLWILWTKNTKIRITLTWKHRVLHGTSQTCFSAAQWDPSLSGSQHHESVLRYGDLFRASVVQLLGYVGSLLSLFSLGLHMTHHRSADTLRGTPCVSVADWNQQNVCICALFGEVIRLAPKMLVWHHCQHVFAIPWTKQSRPSLLLRVKHLLGCDDKCILSVPLSTNDLKNSRLQSGGICQVLSLEPSRCFATCSRTTTTSRKPQQCSSKNMR